MFQREILEYLVHNGGFQVAVEFALNEFPTIQYQALVLMRNLITAPVKEAVDQFHEADGMATIFTILKSRKFQVRRK